MRKTLWIFLALRVSAVCISGRRASAADCERERKAVEIYRDELATAEKSGNAGKISAAKANLEKALKELRTCVEQAGKKAGGGQAPAACYFEKTELEVAREAHTREVLKGGDRDKQKQLKRALDARAKEYCECLVRNKLPLDEICSDPDVNVAYPPPPPPPTPPKPKTGPPPDRPKHHGGPPPRPPCDREKSEFDYQQRWAGMLEKDDPAKAKEKIEAARKAYCECVKEKGIQPVPAVCAEGSSVGPPPREVEPPDFGWGTKPKTTSPPPPAEPPPPPGKTSSPPPPPSTTTPPPPPKVAPPPPPPKTAPPPPPPSTGAAAPPPPSTTYVCGKSPCDCLKQNPPKKCTTSSCVCAKG